MSHPDVDDAFSLFTAIPRAIVAAVIAAICYLITRYALLPRALSQLAFPGKLATYLSLGMALLIFGAVFWRLMQGGSISEELGKLGDIDLH